MGRGNLPAIAAFAGWLATAAVDFVLGLILGTILIPVAGYVIAPAWRAIKGMLPHNSLGRQMLKKLKVYAGPEHPHAAQQPQNYEIKQVAQ